MFERSISAATKATLSISEPDIDGASTSTNYVLKFPKLSLPTFDGKYT